LRWVKHQLLLLLLLVLQLELLLQLLHLLKLLKLLLLLQELRHSGNVSRARCRRRRRWDCRLLLQLLLLHRRASGDREPTTATTGGMR
jgi:hypothetical protein